MAGPSLLLCQVLSAQCGGRQAVPTSEAHPTPHLGSGVSPSSLRAPHHPLTHSPAQPAHPSAEGGSEGGSALSNPLCPLPPHLQAWVGWQGWARGFEEPIPSQGSGTCFGPGPQKTVNRETEIGPTWLSRGLGGSWVWVSCSLMGLGVRTPPSCPHPHLDPWGPPPPFPRVLGHTSLCLPICKIDP